MLPIGYSSRPAALGDLKRIGALFTSRGNARCLLRTSFAVFAGRGHEAVALSVDTENTSGAVGLYESVGMRVRISYDNYRKMIRA